MDKKTNKNKILILGAGGFIGTNLCRRLISDGESIKVFDRPGVDFSNLYTYANNLNKPTPEIIYDNFNCFSDLTKSKEYLEDVKIVYHLISTTCPTNSNIDVANEFESNVLATIKLLDSSVANQVSRVVFLSSGGTVYGKTSEAVLQEGSSENPISSYGIQKLCIEKILYLYNELYGLDYRIIRLSNPFGPYQRPNGVQGVISTFTWKALNDEAICIYGDGSVVRDYIYIDDAVDGILNISSDNATYKLYNLGSGIGTSVNEVVDSIKAALGKNIDITHTPGRQVDVPINVLDITRYTNDFGNPATVSLETGIKKLAQFYKEQ